MIDVQNEYVTGELPIADPPVRDSLARIGQAMDVAEDAGIPVVVVQQLAPATSAIFASGSAGAELHPSVATRRRDLLVEKTLPSAFGAHRSRHGCERTTSTRSRPSAI